MNAISRMIKTYSPGWLTEATVFLQLNVFPASFYRRQTRLWRQAGSVRYVRGGPFRGLKYTRCAADKALLPRLFGTYECELHDSVEKLCVAQPDVIVVAGAGEGYYAAGLAHRIPTARVFAYDGFRWARYLMQRIARLNQLDRRLEVRGLLDPQQLEPLLAAAERPAVVCDVDGYELELLDPTRVPSLARTTILLELHDHLLPGVADAMSQRFAATHNIQHIHDRPRTVEDLNPALPMSREDTLWGINEAQFRGVRQSWMYMTPFCSAES